eukprot:6325696-Pyramimonas_sp.AAC.1
MGLTYAPPFAPFVSKHVHLLLQTGRSGNERAIFFEAGWGRAKGCAVSSKRTTRQHHRPNDHEPTAATRMT